MGPQNKATVIEEIKASDMETKHDIETFRVESALGTTTTSSTSTSTSAIKSQQLRVHRGPSSTIQSHHETPSFRETMLHTTAINLTYNSKVGEGKEESKKTDTTEAKRSTSDGSANSSSLSPFAKTYVNVAATSATTTPLLVGRPSPSWRNHLGSQLYGREHELELLKKEFEACRTNPSRMILLSGKEGTGKAVLVQRGLQDCVQESNGCLISGKFDRYSGMIPYSAYIMAFTELVQQIREQGEAKVQAFRTSIDSALGDEKWVLATMIPSLSPLLGSHDDDDDDDDIAVPSLNAEQTGTRFNFALRKSLRAMCSRDKPLVLFLGNVHRADSASLDLLYSLAVDKDNEGLIIVCTTNDGAGPVSCLPERVRDSYEKDICITNIPVNNLSESAIRAMLGEVMTLDDANCFELTRMIYERTKGNILHVIKYLDWLQQKEILNIDATSGMATIRSEQDTFLERLSCQSLIKEWISTLPPTVCDVLKVATCLGSKLNGYLIQCVLGFDVVDILNELVHCGILYQSTVDSSYTFIDDTVENILYEELTTNERRGRLHLEVGRRIWRKLSEEELDHTYLFLVVSQFHLAKKLIKREEEQVAVATLCLHAGLKAAKASSFQIAAKHLELGLSVISSSSTDSRSWRSNKYDLLLALHNAVGEMHMCTGNVERMDKVLDDVFLNARRESDKLQAYVTRIGAYSYSDKQDEAIDLGVQVLKSLGESFPSRSCNAALLSEYKKVGKLLKGKTDEQLLRIPYITDETKLQCLQILNVMLLPSIIQRPKFTPFVMLKVMKLTLMHGLSALAAPSFGVYGMLCIAAINDFDSARRFANLSLAVIDKFKSIEYIPRVYAATYGCILPWIRPLSEVIDPMLKAYNVGLETGDIEFASLCANIYLLDGCVTGEPLQNIDQWWRTFRGTLVLYRQGSSLKMLLPHVQMIHHLMGVTNDPLSGKGNLVDYDEVYKIAVSKNDIPTMIAIKECRMQLSYIFNDYPAAAHFCLTFTELAETPPSLERVTGLYFISLICIATARLRGGTRVRQNLREAKKCLKSLKFWAQHRPENFINKILVVEGELASMQNKNFCAHEKFVCAISLSKTYGFLQDAALAHELYARHLMAMNNRDEARSNFTNACEYYEKWGAMAKVKQLRMYMMDSHLL